MKLQRWIKLGTLVCVYGCGGSGSESKQPDASAHAPQLEPDAGDHSPAAGHDAATHDAATRDAGPGDVPGPPVAVLPPLRTISLRASCAIIQTGDLTCWRNSFQFATRTQAVEIDSNRINLCTLDEAGALECVDLGNSPVLADETAPFKFSQIAVGDITGVLCGVTLEGQALCWDAQGVPEKDRPSNIAQVEVGDDGSIAVLDRDGVARALDGEAYFDTAVPFVQLSSYEGNLCGLRSDGAVRCLEGSTSDSKPGERFRRFELGSSFTCGIREDQTIACWAIPGMEAPAAPPGGDYVDLIYVGPGMCGVKSDGAIVCGSGTVVAGLPADLRVRTK